MSEQPICAPRGTLLPRMPNIKNPHRKNLSPSGGSSSSGSGPAPGNRNRSNSRATPTTAPPTTSTRAYRPTEATTEDLYSARGHADRSGVGWAVGGGSGVLVVSGGEGVLGETPQNDVLLLSSTEESSIETASEELSSRNSATVTQTSASSHLRVPHSFTVVLFALLSLSLCLSTSCTYVSHRPKTS
jgi:hypothetical protein